MDHYPATFEFTASAADWLLKFVRILYRIRQFWRAIYSQVTPQDLEQVHSLLSPKQMALFTSLQAGEQAHALEVLRRLLAQGENHPDLLKAALLHDVGKSRLPLRPWERAIIVLAKTICPQHVTRWGNEPMDNSQKAGWRRPFLVAEQHPVWGAAMAREAGVSPLVESLIRHHQQPISIESTGLENELLQKLQAVDNES